MCLQYKGHRELFLLFEDLLCDSLSRVLIKLRNAILAFKFDIIALLAIGYECATFSIAIPVKLCIYLRENVVAYVVAVDMCHEVGLINLTVANGNLLLQNKVSYL